MGIESTERVNKELYKRPQTDSKVIEVTKILNSHKGLTCDYDIIIDNPYETKEDVKNKIRLISNIPKPFILGVCSLILYPHTDLYTKAKADGMLDEHNGNVIKNMSFVNKKYFNSLLIMTPYLPKKIVDFFLENDGRVGEVMVRSIRQLYEISLNLPLPIKRLISKVTV